MFRMNFKHTALIATAVSALTVFGAGSALAMDNEDGMSHDQMSNNSNGTEMQEDKAGAGHSDSMSHEDSMSGDKGMSHDDSMSSEDSMSEDDGMSDDDSMSSEDSMDSEDE